MREMADQWIIRVLGKEYGPADIETLREWKTEGRLLPENEARRVDVDPAPKPFGGKGEETPWTTAAEIPGLFGVEATVSAAERLAEPPAQLQRRSFAQILVETFRVYRKGFVQFLSLTLLVVLPSVSGQLASAWLQTAPNMNFDLRSVAAGAFGFCMMLVTMLLWPIYIAGIQILTAEFAAGQRIGFVAALNEAVRFWPRVATLCIFVYGAYIFWTALPLLIIWMIMTGPLSLLSVLLVLALLAFQVWMIGRLFVNFLFWQQFAVLADSEAAGALRQSKQLARSERDLPWYRRPLWRGVLLFSIWSAFVLAITLGPEWSTLRHYFNELTTTQDPQAFLQQLSATQQAHSFDIFSFSLNLVQRILQPLLGIAFVLLYLDSKTRDDQS